MNDHYLSVLRACPERSSRPVVVLAPLSGVTDLHMRRIARRCGADAVVSEMVAAEAFTKGSDEARVRAEGAGLEPHIVQLAGCAPAAMAAGARLAVAGGADAIDVNMGCPAKTVTGGAAGSALMRDLGHAADILRAVRDAVRVPVTVKMRLGWDESMRNAPELARRAEAIGLDGVVVHGRTRQQFYGGRADWDAIRSVVAAVRIPVIANGDIVGVEDARRCLAASGAAGIMVGRGAVGRPWLVGAIAAALDGRERPEPSRAERAALALEHYDGLLTLYGASMGVRHARKHLAAYVDAAGPGAIAPDARRTLLTTNDPGEARVLLARAFLGPATTSAPAIGKAA